MKKLFGKSMATAMLATVISLIGLVQPTSATATNNTYTNSSNNTTITVNVGDTVVVSLNSVYIIPEGRPGSTLTPKSPLQVSFYAWQHFASSNVAALSPLGQTVFMGTPSTIPGLLDLNSSQTYVAAGAGTATVTAAVESYDVCGSQRACPGEHFLRRYKLTVRMVSPVTCGHVHYANPNQFCP